MLTGEERAHAYSSERGGPPRPSTHHTGLAPDARPAAKANP